MKLALLLDRFDPERGGLEHWAWQWTQWLLARGAAVTVMASEVRADLARERLSLRGLGFAESRLAFARRVVEQVGELRVDVVHDLGVGWRYDVLQPQFGTRVADDRQNLRALSGWRRVRAQFSRARRRRLRDVREVERRQYVDNPGHVVAVSAMTRADLQREYGLAAERISVIHNGVDVDRFRPPDAATRARTRQRDGWTDRVLLLFAAHNFRLKGLDIVLHAMARLRAPQLHLLVTGRGAIDTYAALAARLGLGDRVSFAGFVPDVRAAFTVADLFVQPTFYDPCSLVLLEAAASGVPALTSRCNGAAELFEDGESASIAADPGDVREVARRIAILLDPHVRVRMGAAAQAVARRASADAAFRTLFELCQAQAGRAARHRS